MKLVSLKMSKKEREAQHEPLSESDEDKYPWSTRMHLDADTVDKLGLAGCRAGEEVEIQAVAVVRSVTSNDVEGRGHKVTIDLQMTDMGASKPGDTEAKAKTLYPSTKE